MYENKGEKVRGGEKMCLMLHTLEVAISSLHGQIDSFPVARSR